MELYKGQQGEMENIPWQINVYPRVMNVTYQQMHSEWIKVKMGKWGGTESKLGKREEYVKSKAPHAEVTKKIIEWIEV